MRISISDQGQHHWNFGQYAHCCRQSRRAGGSKQSNRYRNGQFKEIGCTNHSRRGRNPVRQLQQLACHKGDEKDQEGLQDQWNSDQHDVQWVLQDYLALEHEDQNQCQQESDGGDGIKLMHKYILEIVCAFLLCHDHTGDDPARQRNDHKQQHAQERSARCPQHPGQSGRR